MSKVSIQGDISGTGDFTIKAPNSNVDRTLNLPDEAGTVLTNVSDIETQVKTATSATGSAPVYACRAWVNFDGEGTVSIRDSGNVSSITDLGTGNYRVNFTTAMPDADYCVSGASKGQSDDTGFRVFTFTTFNFRCTTASLGSATDTPIGAFSVFR
jgi:hypothetical protein